MKNFPHQFNDFAKVRRALNAIQEFHRLGRPIGDDEELGYELARRGIHSFRNIGKESLEDRIARERRKKSSNQGARTKARELRKTLIHLDFIRGAPDWSLTDAGGRLLSSNVGSAEEQDVWLSALFSLELADSNDRRSHPIRILVWLLQHHGEHLGPGFSGMELALEAKDDSEDELIRIGGLARMPSKDRERTLREELRVRPFQIQNARKILPAFARDAGLMSRVGSSERFSLTRLGRAAYEEAFGSEPVDLQFRPREAVRRSGEAQRVRLIGARRGPISRQVTPESVGSIPTIDPSTWTTLSDEEQFEAMRLRLERTERHQELVRQLAALLQELDLRDSPSSYDLLAVPTDTNPPAILFEVKTLSGNDDRSQVQRATFQLLYYRFLIEEGGELPSRDIRLAIALESGIDESLVRFLDRIDIAALALDSDGLHALNTTASHLLRGLGFDSDGSPMPAPTD